MLLNNILEDVGNTPSVRFNRIGKELSCEMYGKCEFLNPGGSVKDRIAVKMVEDAENKGASVEELNSLLGRARAKQGMFEGNMEEGELEIGQVSSLIKEIKPAGEVVSEVWAEFKQTAQAPFTF